MRAASLPSLEGSRFRKPRYRNQCARQQRLTLANAGLDLQPALLTPILSPQIANEARRPSDGPKNHPNRMVVPSRKVPLRHKQDRDWNRNPEVTGALFRHPGDPLTAFLRGLPSSG